MRARKLVLRFFEASTSLLRRGVEEEVITYVD